MFTYHAEAATIFLLKEKVRQEFGFIMPSEVQSSPAIPDPIASAPIENAAAVDRLKELIATIALPDDKLVDKIFPNGAGGEI